MRKKRLISPYAGFLLFNLCFFMMDTTASYFTIYLNEIGLSKRMIGTINGMGSLCAMASQPILGMLADQARSKRRILQGLILCTAVLYPLILLNQNTVYILVVFCLYCAVRRFQPSLNTSMSVEYAEQSGRAYGPIRMMGAIGYSLAMAVVAQISGLEGSGTRLTFFTYSAICFLNVGLIFFLPPMSGHNHKSEGPTLSPLTILKNKPILALILFQMLMSISHGLYGSFFSIYFTSDMGGSNAAYGITLSVAAAIEIPFLFFADKIIRRLGTRGTLLVIGTLSSLRWFLTYLAPTTGVLLVVQGLNFLNIVQTVAISLALSRLIAPQFKTTVQSLAVTFQSVVSVLVSSFLGGVMADLFGRPLFFIAGVIALATTLVFCVFIFRIIPDESRRLGDCA